MEPTYSDLNSFLASKNAILAEVEAAVYRTLKAMGPDIKGIAWFSSAAESYACGVTNKAA